MNFDQVQDEIASPEMAHCSGLPTIEGRSGLQPIRVTIRICLTYEAEISRGQALE